MRVGAIGLRRNARIMAVTSGKGGVGKTSIALNLAIVLSQIGRRVLLVDADLGLANVDILLGISPRHTIEEVIRGRCSVFEATFEGPEGITILPAASGALEPDLWRRGDIARIRGDLAKLEGGFDLILIDTGAGISTKVTDFVLCADEVMVIATPEPTSIADAYAMIKIIQRQREDIWIDLLINMARSHEEAAVIYDRFNQIVQRFLGINVGDRGYIPYDGTVGEAIRHQIPFFLETPHSPASKKMSVLAKGVLRASRKGSEEQEAGLFARIWEMKLASPESGG